MILIWLIIIPLISGLAAWFLGRTNTSRSRWISLAALGLDAVLLFRVWSAESACDALDRGTWLVELNVPWIPQLGINLGPFGIEGPRLRIVR